MATFNSHHIKSFNLFQQQHKVFSSIVYIYNDDVVRLLIIDIFESEPKHSYSYPYSICLTMLRREIMKFVLVLLLK